MVFSESLPIQATKPEPTVFRLEDLAEADLHQLYRRMVFNLLVGNSDDHIKNHGVLLQGNGQGRGRYRLALSTLAAHGADDALVRRVRDFLNRQRLRIRATL